MTGRQSLFAELTQRLGSLQLGRQCKRRLMLIIGQVYLLKLAKIYNMQKVSIFVKPRLHERPSHQRISSQQPSHLFEYTSRTFAQMLQLVAKVSHVQCLQSSREQLHSRSEEVAHLNMQWLSRYLLLRYVIISYCFSF